ncbi:hypothetical protein ACFXTH_000858 [Malus domestica]
MADSDNTIIKKGDGESFADPYFLHPSDHPGLILVSKKLTGDNYNTWCRAMEISLGAKNKIGFINGKVNMPSETKQPDAYAAWQRCNNMLLAWIINSIESDISDSILYLKTAYEVWEDLRERFSQSNAPRIFQLQREIASLTQGQQSVAVYYTKLKGLWDELASYSSSTICTCGAQHETNRLMQFLMGLNESYSAIRGQILLMNPLPSYRQAYSSIIQEEKQRELGTGSRSLTEPAAMAVRHQQQSSKKQHQQSQTSSNSRPPLHCSYCDAKYHTVETCWQKNGYPPDHPRHNPNMTRKSKQNGGGSGFSRGSSSAHHVASTPTIKALQAAVPNLSEKQYADIFSALTSKNDESQAANEAPQAHAALTSPPPSGLSPLVPGRWIIDSGATDHITCSSSLLTNSINNTSLPPVSLPSGEKASITSIGNIQLSDLLQLKDVLCVPSFQVDLLSVGKITDGLHCSVTFFPSWCILQDLISKVTIGVGKRRGNLYYLPLCKTDPPVTSLPFLLTFGTAVWGILLLGVYNI